MTAISVPNSGIPFASVVSELAGGIRRFIAASFPAKPQVAQGPRQQSAMKPVAAGRAATPTAAAARLSAGDQWAKLTDVVATAINRANSAATLQTSATQQLDLAQYGLSTLMDELSAVMTVPGRRERPAQVYVFGAPAAAQSSHALAA
jgi:hypothetical protein